MAHFSRLTDIVECNLTTLLEAADNPQELLTDIIQEMAEGMAGARRSMETAKNNATRLQAELDENKEQVNYWAEEALKSLEANDENQARLALFRKREHADVLTSLEQNMNAASETVDHLGKTYRALAARLAESQRKAKVLAAGGSLEAAEQAVPQDVDPNTANEIEDELAAMKRNLGQA